MKQPEGLLHTDLSRKEFVDLGLTAVHLLLSKTALGASIISLAGGRSDIVDLSRNPFLMDVENVVIAGNYEWGYHGNGESLIAALKKLRTHFKNGSTSSLPAALLLVANNHGVKYGRGTLEPMSRFAMCSDADFEFFEKGLRSQMARRQEKQRRHEQKRLSDILDKHPLQYVTADAVGLILGVECEEVGDLHQILGKKMSHNFSPKKPNTPNHHVGFVGIVTKIHCILSGKITEQSDN